MPREEEAGCVQHDGPRCTGVVLAQLVPASREQREARQFVVFPGVSIEASAAIERHPAESHVVHAAQAAFADEAGFDQAHPQSGQRGQAPGRREAAQLAGLARKTATRIP
jgi:hypothetical protein